VLMDMAGHVPAYQRWCACGRKPAHIQQLVDLLLGRHVHERSLAGAQLDPALHTETVQGLPDRLAAGPEMPGKLRLDEMQAGREGAIDDQFNQRVIDALAKRNGPFHRPDRRAKGPARGGPAARWNHTARPAKPYSELPGEAWS
jgi:hypothetical protein